MGPIPWSSVDRYARRTGIQDIEAFDRFAGLIRAMDSEWSKIMAKRAKEETKP